MKKLLMVSMLIASSSAFAQPPVSTGGSVTFATANSGINVDINGSGHAGGVVTNTSTATVSPGHHGGQVVTTTSTTSGFVGSHNGFGPGNTTSIVGGASGLAGAAGTTGNATPLWSNAFVGNYFQPAQ